MDHTPALDKPLRTEAQVIRERGGFVSGYVTVWRGSDGCETTWHRTREEALEAASEEYPNAKYVGTITLFKHGPMALHEDWSEEAAAYREAANREWRASLRDLPAHMGKAL